MTRTLAIAALALLASGCQTRTMIILKDPTTGNLVECRAHPILGDPALTSELCAQSYQRAGYVRIAP